MTRITLPITATEANAVEAAKISGERVFIVREGNQHWKMLPDAPVVVDASPPAEFVQACAPCPEPTPDRRRTWFPFGRTTCL